jgi:hypothetical protein
MPTAVVQNKVKPELTADQRNKIKRERRALQDTLADAKENLDIANDELNRAADPSLDAEVYVTAHGKVKDMQSHLATAEHALVMFNKSFATDEEIARRDREDEQRAAAAAHELHKTAFIANRNAAYSLIQDVLKLDGEAKEMLTKAGLGMQAAECATTVEALHRFCANRGFDVRSALSSLRGTLEKI